MILVQPETVYPWWAYVGAVGVKLTYDVAKAALYLWLGRSTRVEA